MREVLVDLYHVDAVCYILTGDSAKRTAGAFIHVQNMAALKTCCTYLLLSIELITSRFSIFEPQNVKLLIGVSQSVPSPENLPEPCPKRNKEAYEEANVR